MEDTQSSPRVRKKGGRGPGKKEHKEKTGVSVRWEEGELQTRLVESLHSNELWAGVFIATSTAEHSRAVIGMPKSDLQREIARHIFADDPRFDMDDPRTVELLGTSVKNKVNKIRKLYSEAKEELGPAAVNIKDESDIPPDSELAVTWARVKEKLPQYFQVRDIMVRPVVASQAIDSTVGDSSVAGPAQSPQNLRGGRSLSTPFPMVPSPGLPYTDSPMLSPMQNSQSGRQSVQPQYNPRYYPTLQSTPQRVAYPIPFQGMSSLDAGPSSSQQPQHQHQHQQQAYFPSLPPPSFNLPPPPLQIPSAGDTQRPTRTSPLQGTRGSQHDSRSPTNYPLQGAEEDIPLPLSRSGSQDSPTPPPSPPLTQALFQMFRSLETRKRQRDEDYVALKRIKLEHREAQKEREERERQRWHEREVLRLQIQLEQLKRENAGELPEEVTSGPVEVGSLQAHHQQLQQAIESHERGGGATERMEAPMRPQHMSLDTPHHPQHLQHHSMHGGATSEVLSGDAALDALASLREGTGSNGMR